MEKQVEKIKRFSNIICILLKIAFIALIVVGVMELFAWIWLIANLHTEMVMINGVERELPILFKLGDVRVAWPVIWESGFNFTERFSSRRFVTSVGISDLLSTVFTLVALRYAMRIFKLLRENGSPFRDDVVRALRKLAIVLLVVGGVTGMISFLAAGIAWVLCLIFDYGRILQNESDTTL